MIVVAVTAGTVADILVIETIAGIVERLAGKIVGGTVPSAAGQLDEQATHKKITATTMGLRVLQDQIIGLFTFACIKWSDEALRANSIRKCTGYAWHSSNAAQGDMRAGFH